MEVGDDGQAGADQNAQDAEDAGDAEGLFKAAQRALEKAQEQGGDRVEAAAVSLELSPSS